MVELRKRPATTLSAASAAAAAPPPPTKRRASASSMKKSKKGTESSSASPAVPAVPAAAPAKELAVGDTIDLNTNIGSIEVTTDEGKPVTLKELHEQSAGSNGIVIFTYPKASTPGCTTQAQLFRDSHDMFTTNNKNNKNITNTTSTTSSLTVFGLSTDTPKANASFKAKHNLPYTLLCDPPGTLVRALGMVHDSNVKKTARRGVVVLVNDHHDDDDNHDGVEEGEEEGGGGGRGDKVKSKVAVAVAVKGGPATTVEAVKTFMLGQNSRL